MNTKYKAGVLFDLDGVLIDSESRYTEFWNSIERLYPTGIPDYAMAIKGTTLQTILCNYPSEQVRDDITVRLQQFQSNMPFELYPGVEELLIGLRGAGFGIAIVTSSDSRKMQVLWRELPHLRSNVDVVIDGSQVTRSKPDPQGYLLAARMLGLDPRQCFVFEDSLQGLAAGRASGAMVVGVATTYQHRQIAGLADIVVDFASQVTVEQLLRML